MNHFFFPLAMIASTTLAGCSSTPEPETPRIGMANPASVYCQKIGGKSEPAQGPHGAFAYCVLPDGSKLEEWELFRRDHPSK